MITEQIILKIPKVTVLMSVYNGERYIKEAVDSILAQTFSDFEFLIIDDASTDKTPEILRSYGDPRIKIITNKENVGLTKSLNKGLALVRGEYIARMDADDISMHDRLEKQVKFLDVNPNVGLLGSSWYVINEESKEISYSEALNGRDAVHFMCHGTVLIRKHFLEKVGFYREIFEYAQDYDLWLRIADESEVANLGKALYKLRVHKESISVKKKMQQDLYASLALKMSKERKKTGKDSLDLLDQENVIEIRDQWLGMHGFERRKALSYNLSTWSQAALNLNIGSQSINYAINALTIYALNTDAWKILINILKYKYLKK